MRKYLPGSFTPPDPLEQTAAALANRPVPVANNVASSSGSDVQEGIIVKCIQRLDELLRDLLRAAPLLGAGQLARTCQEASVRIRRDIVFAGSLYLQ